MTNGERYQLINDTINAGNPTLAEGQHVTVYQWRAGDLVKYDTGIINRILKNGKVEVNLTHKRDREYFRPHLVR